MDIYQKWKHNYIDNLDLTKIKWVKLNTEELNAFLYENYFDEEEYRYVNDEFNTTPFDVPLGMHYLSFNFNCNEYSFLLGIVKNNIGKYTIVATIIYLENEFIFSDQKDPVTYISSVEVNSYFRNQGIYKKICERFIDYINVNQHLIGSRESEMGAKCQAFEKLKKIIIKKGFQQSILKNDNPYNTELHDTICVKQKVLNK